MEIAPNEDATEAARLLPPGFSLQSAQADAVAISGSGDATSLDRGALNDRLQAIGLGQFDPATGQFAAGFGPGGGQFPGGGGGFGGPGLGGGPGGPDQIGGGRGGGPGGRGGFVLGGRGARGQNPYQGTTTYTFGGSALDSRTVSTASGCAGHAAAVQPEHFRHDVRRAREDSRDCTRTRIAGRTSSSITRAIARTTCSISMRRFRPRPCATAIFPEALSS